MHAGRGFTLIELLLVMAIIGVLAAIVLASLTSAREKAQVAAYKAQAHSVQAAALIACDGDANGILVDGEVATPAAQSKLNPIAFTHSSCGINGTGVFLLEVEAINIGSGAAATACQLDNQTDITQDGVTFPPGC